jgi:GNAT superfamily N-acetyltransferase
LNGITVRALPEGDLSEADRVFRLAFGTHFGLADPLTHRGDAEMVRTRWRSDPAGAFGAYRDGRLIGSALCTRFGSFGTFGPITVHPDHWDSGAGKLLLQPAMELLERWGVRQAGLFTFAQSPKHVGLYQKYGFWPQYLTTVMSKTAQRAENPVRWSCHSRSPADLSQCARLTGEVFPGLDAGTEIRAIADQGLGDTVLLWSGRTLQAVAACHIGKGSEAGSGATYIKFAAVRPGPDAGDGFERLLSACEAFAIERASRKMVAGVNTARHHAYRALLRRGYRSFLHGVAMQRPNQAGFNTADSFVIDDWR